MCRMCVSSMWLCLDVSVCLDQVTSMSLDMLGYKTAALLIFGLVHGGIRTLMVVKWTRDMWYSLRSRF